MLQNLSNLACLGDNFWRFSHPNAQTLAQSQIPKLCVWPGTVFRCQHLPGSMQQQFCAEVSMGVRGEAGRTGEPGEGFCVWRVRHRFSEGVCKVRSSEVWVFPFPWWEQSRVLEWLQGCQLYWGSWRPARAGGDGGKGWVASKCGGSHASLLGAHPRCWVGIRCAQNPCEVLAACGWGVSVQGVWDSWVVVIIEQTRVLTKNYLGMSTLPCLRLMRLIGAFPPGSLCREVQRFGFSRWVPLSEGWGGSKNVIKGLSSWNWVNKSLWSVFPSVPYALDGNGSRCKLSFYFFNCLQMLMLPFV